MRGGGVWLPWFPALGMLVAAAAGCVWTDGGYAAARERMVAEVELDRVGAIGPVPSQNRLPPLPDDLSAYIRYALEHNPSLHRAFQRWRAAWERVLQASSLPEPVLTYGYFLRSVQTRLGPQRHRLTVMQKLPWFGKLDLRARRAAAEAMAAGYQFEAERRRLVFQVCRAYYEYAYLASAIRITRRNKLLLADAERALRALFKAGKAPQQHLIALQLELGRVEDHLRSLTDRLREARAQLNALLNRPVGAPLTLPARLPDPVAPPDGADLFLRLARNNPSLRALDSRLVQASANLELARKDYWPDLTLGISWVEVGEGAPMAGGEEGKDALLLTGSINLPIWRAKLRSAVREAEANLLAVRAARRAMRNQLRARLESALFRLRDAHRKVDLYQRSLIPRAEQAFRAARTGYIAGRVDFQGFVDSHRLLLQLELARERALADLAQCLAEVRMLAPEETAP